MKEKVYISGPITGLERHVYINNFADTELKLRANGYKVINPTKLLPSRFLWIYKIIGYKLTLLYDIWHLLNCDGIYMIDGWQWSKGARLERAIAQLFNIELIKL